MTEINENIHTPTEDTQAGVPTSVPTMPQSVEDNNLPEKQYDDTEIEDEVVEVEYTSTARVVPDEDANAVRAEPSRIPNVKIKKIIKPDLDDIEELNDVLITVRGTGQSVAAAMERMVKQDIDGKDGNDVVMWAALIDKAINEYHVYNDQLFEAVIRKGSVWVNQVPVADGEKETHIGLVSDKKGINPADKNDIAAIALTKVIGNLGIGLPDLVPCYQTGIWVKLNTPTAAEFIRLDEIIAKEKVHYGSLTRGAIFSNQSVILRKHVTNFILDHITWTTAPSMDKDYLKSIIKATDLDMLMLGLMYTRYQDGYPFAQSCTVNPGKCTHITEGLIDLRELAWTDKNLLTEKQKRLMRSPRKRITEEQLREYQEEFQFKNNGKIILSRDTDVDEENIENGVIINLETPSLAQEEDYGIEWINNLVSNAENVFREKHSEKDRQQYINNEVLVSSFKTYGQWVGSVDVYENGVLLKRFTDREELDTIFDHLSSEIKYVDIFKRSIHKYITDTIVTVIGVLNYECPACGGKHDTSPGPHHIILPIDVLYYFFTQVQSSVKRSILESTMS